MFWWEELCLTCTQAVLHGWGSFSALICIVQPLLNTDLLVASKYCMPYKCFSNACGGMETSNPIEDEILALNVQIWMVAKQLQSFTRSTKRLRTRKTGIGKPVIWMIELRTLRIMGTLACTSFLRRGNPLGKLKFGVAVPILPPVMIKILWKVS